MLLYDFKASLGSGSRLYELGVSKRAIKKRIKDALKLSTREINLIYKNVIWQDYARYEPIYRTKGKPWIPYEKNRQLQQLVSGVKTQTLGEFKNITQSLGFAAIFVAACVAVWTACFFSPAFEPIVSEYWQGFAYSWQEVINILTQTYVLGFFNEIAAQIVLGALAVIGWIRCVYERKTRLHVGR